jgi:hypothetical protein
MTNEVVIHVTAKNHVKPGFDTAIREVDTFADNAAYSFSKRFGMRIARLRDHIRQPLDEAGKAMGNTMAETSSYSFMNRFGRMIGDLGKRAGGSIVSLGQEIGQRLGQSISSALRTNTDLSQTSRVVGDRMGDEIGRSAADGINRRLRDSKDRFTSGSGSGGIPGRDGADGGDKDKDGFFERLVKRAASSGLRAAMGFGDNFAKGFMQWASSSVVGQIATLFAIALAGALAGPLLAAVGAAITSAIGLALGGGVIAAGVASAFKDPRIQSAAGELKDKLSKLFEEFGKPFRGPVASFLEKFAGFIDSLAPKFKRLGEIFAPLTQKLGDGIIGALQNAMPGILTAVERSAPFIETLANRLPEIGQAIGDFFEKISGQSDDAAVFFNDLITLVIKLIGALGTLISVFTSMYANIRQFVNNAKDAFLDFVAFVLGILGRLVQGAEAALSWIPGIGGKLKDARSKFAAFQKNVNAELAKIRDRDVKVRVRVIGLAAAQAALSVANQLSAMGYAHGGITGAATGGNHGGLRWVGERGPELMNVPAGSTVHSSGDSMRMLRQGMQNAGQGGSGMSLTAHVSPELESTLIGEIVKMLRFEIGNQGGDVQTVLGSGA